VLRIYLEEDQDLLLLHTKLFFPHADCSGSVVHYYEPTKKSLDLDV